MRSLTGHIFYDIQKLNIESIYHFLLAFLQTMLYFGYFGHNASAAFGSFFFPHTDAHNRGKVSTSS